MPLNKETKPKHFPLLAKVLWTKINSILFLNLKQKRLQHYYNLSYLQSYGSYVYWDTQHDFLWYRMLLQSLGLFCLHCLFNFFWVEFFGGSSRRILLCLKKFWELIFIYCGLFCPHLGSFFFFLCCFFFHYVSAKFHLWPSSGDFYRDLG